MKLILFFNKELKTHIIVKSNFIMHSCRDVEALKKERHFGQSPYITPFKIPHEKLFKIL